MHQFNEWHPRFAGLSELYETEIRGGLAGRDPARRQALLGAGGTLLLMLPTAALFFFGSGVLSQGTGIPTDLFQFVGAALLAGAMWLAKRRYDKVRNEVKGFIMGPLCGLLDLSFSVEAPSAPLDHFDDLDLLPSYNRQHTEDEIRGTHESVPFFLIEAVLTQKARRSSRTVFRGLLIYFAFPKPFRGRTILTKDQGWLGNVFGKLGHAGERIRLEDPRFEEVFEVYGTDQVEARYLLTPAFMERLVELAGGIGSGGIQLAFDDNKLLIALNRSENQFEAGSLFSGLEDPERVQTIVDQIGEIFRIIEVLNLNMKTRA